MANVLQHAPLGTRLAAKLRRSPHMRSALYLSSMVALLIAARALNRKFVTDPTSIWYGDMNTTALPAVLAVTYAFARLHPEDRTAWHSRATKADLYQLGEGVALGTAAITAVLGTAASKGWIAAPAWGWDQAPLLQVLETITGQSVKYAIAAWEEEMVFRGYGFDALRQAIGPVWATVVSVLLFAQYHGPADMRTFLTMTLGGVMFTLLRLKYERLWLPFGFHLAWNLVQTVVFGPKAGFPSVRPIELHGPPEWIGVPGLPEPGRLSMLATAAVTALIAYQLWRAARAHSPGGSDAQHEV